jgi:predicted O-linked N-acetylglucosamine transferase (SPINDLY family)
MDSTAAALAAQRLAAVQCIASGHPVTTGYPSLDYFLSSDLMEPPDAQEHYTERLVRLPNLSIYYEPPELPRVALNRAELGLRPTAMVYWCGQSLFKYLPQHDQVFARIARDAGDCQFVFFRYQGANVTELFKQRLERAFAALGLRADDYCVFLQRMDFPKFLAVFGLSDIFLDSIGFSGGNTTLDSLPYGLPIVTMSAPLMRGRQSMAILKMMGVTETIAETLDEYVSVAVRLARDAGWRMAIRSKMSENATRVFRDASCIAALEDFLDRAARRAST